MIKEFCTNALRRLDRWERWITFLAFTLMTAVVFADVMSREITGSGLPWARHVGVWANIVVTMIGLGIASSTGAHLRPRFADGWLPEVWQPALIRLQEGIMAAFCLAFAVLVCVVVSESIVLQERSAILRVVVWPMQTVLALAFVIGVFRHASYAAFPDLRPVDLER